jgi:thiamine pyrophosphokinase
MSKHIKIFAGPNNYTLATVYQHADDDFLVGVDSGLHYLLQAGWPIDVAIGDFDSVDPKQLGQVEAQSKMIIRLPAQKDMTDLAYCLDWIYNHMDYASITVFGGIGGRIDHFLANVNLLKKYDLTMIDDHHRIWMLKKGRHHIVNPHQYISFFALEDVYDLSIKGFDYELDQYYLATTDSLCVSNRGSGDLEFTKGRLLVVATSDFSAPDGILR